jgi:hypothetical protein
MNGARRAGRALRRTTCRLTDLAGELNYGQRRATVLFLAVDRYHTGSSKAPDTYGEFLARTSGPLIREPSARARLAGRPVG